MENLNDLIWTDENEEISTQGSEMKAVCMVAFCNGGDVGAGGSGDAIIDTGSMTAFACGNTGKSHSAPCK